MVAFPAVTAISSSINTAITIIKEAGSQKKENLQLTLEYNSSLGKLEDNVGWAYSDMETWDQTNEVLSLPMGEIMLDVEDFLADLTKPSIIQQAYMKVFDPLLRVMLFGATPDDRPSVLATIEDFLERIKNVRERTLEKLKTLQDGQHDIMPELLPATAPIWPLKKDLDNGFAERLLKLQELTSPADGGRFLRISVVGCRGVGKSCLARNLFDVSDLKTLTGTVSSSSLFWRWSHSSPTCKIWINASTCKSADELRHEIIKSTETIEGGPKTIEEMYKFLLSKRYLVIVDDLWNRNIKWADLEALFPENNNDSRLIVTTTDHSISREHSSGRFFIFPVTCLDEDLSKKMMRKTISSEPPRHVTAQELNRSATILKRCNGLPAALLASCKYLASVDSKKFIDEAREDFICQQLSSIVTSTDRAFSDLRRMFVQSYSRLANPDLRLCLLYFSMYPEGHKISGKSFARKLEAESLVAEENVDSCLKGLVETNMVSCTAGKYHLDGLMLQFAIFKAVLRNLVTVVDKGVVQRKRIVHAIPGRMEPKCRRLCISGPSGCLLPTDLDMSHLRSFTIIGDTVNRMTIDAIKWKLFKFLRVLELECCTGFGNSEVLRRICQLNLLKYLCLRRCDVGEIPTEIENLTLLETLDIRISLPLTLPVQVMTLPSLTVLIGKFVFPSLYGRELKRITEFLQTNSKLHTIYGVHVNGSSQFDVIISKAKELRRLKVCGDHCVQPGVAVPAQEPVGCLFGNRDKDEHNAETFSEAVAVISKAIYDRRKNLEHICIDSSSVSKSLLSGPMHGFKMLCLKLIGEINQLPGNELHALDKLKKLSIYGSGLSCDAIVSGLQNLIWLEELHIGKEWSKASWGGKLSVREGGFKSLRQLTLKGPQPLPDIEIAQGGLCVLQSLELLCPYPPEDEDVNMLPELDISAVLNEVKELGLVDDKYLNSKIKVQGASHLDLLCEVVLHHRASNEIVEGWEITAKAHKNLPSVTRRLKRSKLSAWEY